MCAYGLREAERANRDNSIIRGIRVLLEKRMIGRRKYVKGVLTPRGNALLATDIYRYVKRRKRSL